ncbi:MAG: FAD binding domain-containing protein, partial [Bradymonadaceae bacterium]
LVGELDDGEVDYELVTSCLVPLGEMHGKHVVTVEGMNLEEGELNPAQQAVVDYGGTQCGFCTPGFVVSLVWYLMCGEGEPTLDGFQRAIGGNLCRCTGYESLNRASRALVEAFGEGGEHREIWEADDRIAALAEAGMIPAYFTDAAERVAEFPQPEPPDEEIDVADYFVAGGTDIYVQEGEDLPHSRVAVLNHFPEMDEIRLEDGEFRCGGLVSFEQFGQHPEIRRLIPAIDDHLFLVASLHIRNRATLGGNIVNASPIGDMTSLVFALGSDLVLQSEDDRRVVPMEDFYLDYKVMDREEDELLTEVVFPDGDERTRVNFEKVSKRKALDIATVCSGARLRTDDEGRLTEANLTMGGVAPVPLLLEKTRDYLLGREVTSGTVENAIAVADEEISPIGDVRGGADYKRLLVRQLLIAHFTELYPDRVQFKELAS